MENYSTHFVTAYPVRYRKCVHDFPPKTFAAARARALSRWVEGFAAFFGCVEDPPDADGVADSTAAAAVRLRADAGVNTSVIWFWICSAHSCSLRIPEALKS